MQSKSKQALHLDGLTHLDGELVQLVVGLLPLLCRLLLGALALLGCDHDDTRGPLGATSGAELGTARHVDVGDAVVLAKYGNVADDVHGRDVGGENDNTGGRVGCAGDAGGRFADGLDALLDTALEGLVLGSCNDGQYLWYRLISRALGSSHTLLDGLEDLLLLLLVGERVCERNESAEQDSGLLLVALLLGLDDLSDRGVHHSVAVSVDGLALLLLVLLCGDILDVVVGLALLVLLLLLLADIVLGLGHCCGVVCV
jgi:hypothetical protein